MRKALLLIAALWMAAPAPVLAQGQKDASMEELRDQGVLYFKRKRYKQAQVQLDRAYATKLGKKDFKTAYYRAQNAYKQLFIEIAFEMGQLAQKLAADNEKQKRAAAELIDEMSQLYGGVTFAAAKGETNTKGRIFFEAKTGIINKKKKKRFQSIRDRFRSTDVKLPTTVYLPYGEYTANKVPFIIEQGAELATIEIFLQVVVGDTDDNSMMWVYIGGGAVVAAGLAAGAFFLFREPEPEEVRVQEYLFEPSRENAQ